MVRLQEVDGKVKPAEAGVTCVYSIVMRSWRVFMFGLDSCIMEVFFLSSPSRVK